jgi:fused signal recognition particle receptor
MKFFKRKKQAEGKPAQSGETPVGGGPEGGGDNPRPPPDPAGAHPGGAEPNRGSEPQPAPPTVPPGPSEPVSPLPAGASQAGASPVPAAAQHPPAPSASPPGDARAPGDGPTPDQAPPPSAGAPGQRENNVAASPPAGTPASGNGPTSDQASPPSASAPGPGANSAVPEESKEGFFARLRRGLGRTSDNLVQGLGNLFLGRKEIDADLLEELESRLLLADVGIEATMDIIENLTRRVSRKELTSPDALQSALQEELLALLKPCEQPLQAAGHRPFVILMVGVNGVGKTTTIGKLARRYIGEGRSVMLAAGDTFRAAAVEQLQVWGERNNVPVIAQHTGADSASVIYDAFQAARSRGVDVLIADTAGRLHNKDNLMEELKKVVRVMAKLDPSAPHEVMLVLDAGTGQNALAQASQFQQWVGVSGIALTKLDGTAKGGVIFAIARKLGLPIRFIGIGEKAEDLRPFEAQPFIQALFAGDDASA